MTPIDTSFHLLRIIGMKSDAVSWTIGNCARAGQRTWVRPSGSGNPEAQDALAAIAETYGLLPATSSSDEDHEVRH